MNSIRWEIQRESLEDYEYLTLLAAKTTEVKGRLGKAAALIDPRRRALELCRRVVPRIAETERDPARIMAARDAVAREIVALDQSPLLLVQTEPPAGATLVNGPIVVEVWGVCEPGATVTVNGRALETRNDGRFACTASPSGATGEITVEAQRDGKKKVTARRFQVRR